jgi:HAD superfamily hydrolase (TIGR01484 family)
VKRLVAFDLDGTLAESKQPLSVGVAAALSQLLDVADVAIISGGDWPQFEKQVVLQLLPNTRQERLWLLPTTGTKLYRFTEGAWQCAYADLFAPDEKRTILAALDRALAEAGLANERIWGDRIEDRGSQITFSGLGQEAPLDAKEAWDPDCAKRSALQSRLKAALPDLAINLGGTTSIDITRAGIDKAYGLRRLSVESGVALSEMLFLGDAIFPGGNDYPAAQLGLDVVMVRDVAETVSVIRGIVACLKP